MLVTTANHAERQAMGILDVDAVLPKPVRRDPLHQAMVNCFNAAAAERQQKRAEQPTDPAIPADESHTARVLLVEDNRVNQLVAARLLERRGFHVDLAANGRRAIEMFQPGRYAAIFMDCQMPELDGYLATAEIRRFEEGSDHHVTIIAMTANSMLDDRQKCLDAGMDDYLAKPLLTIALTEALARL